VALLPEVVVEPVAPWDLYDLFTPSICDDVYRVVEWGEAVGHSVSALALTMNRVSDALRSMRPPIDGRAVSAGAVNWLEELGVDVKTAVGRALAAAAGRFGECPGISIPQMVRWSVQELLVWSFGETAAPLGAGSLGCRGACPSTENAGVDADRRDVVVFRVSKPDADDDADCDGAAAGLALRPVPEGCRRLFHGTTVEAAHAILTTGVDLSRCSMYCDFGRGFCTTTISSMAMKAAWAKVLSTPVSREAALLVLDVPTAVLDDIDTWNVAGIDWEEFVAASRRQTHFRMHPDLMSRHRPAGAMAGFLSANATAIDCGGAPRRGRDQLAFITQDAANAVVRAAAVQVVLIPQQ
jgi:hypothetical protein